MEKCPLCDTERVAGESLCSNSKCGYEFSNPTEPEQQPEPDWDTLKPKSDADWPESNDSAAQPDQEWLKEHAEPKDTPTQDDTAIIEEQPEQEKQESSNNVTRYYIEDGVTSVQEKPSTNGTKVNGQNITGQGRKELENDDIIELSGIIEVTFQSVTNTDEKKTTEREQLEEKYTKNTSPNKLKEAIYEYRCGDCQHLEIDMSGMKLHQEQNGHYSDPTRIEKS